MPVSNIDSVLTGILVPDPLISGDTLRPIGATAADSSYTEQGPIPGPLVYQRGSIGATSATAGNLGPQLEPFLIGAQNEAVAVRVQRGGMPGIGGCEVACRTPTVDDDDNATTIWQGWTTPQVIEQGSTAFLDRGYDGPRNLDAQDIGNGLLYVVWNDQGTVYGRIYDINAHDWSGSAVTIVDPTRAMDEDGAQPQASSLASGNPVAITRTGTGRLLVAVIVQGPGTDVDLAINYSDDDGATWIASTLSGYDIPLPYDAARDYECISMAWYQGSVLLVVGGSQTDGEDVTPAWVQYASSSDGASFNMVEDGFAVAYDVDPYRPMVGVTLDGTWVVSYQLRPGGGTQGVYCRRISSPYLPLSAADQVGVASPVATLSLVDTAQWLSPDGTVNIGFVRGERVAVARSIDSGATWAEFDTALLKLPGAAVGRLFGFGVNSRVVWLVQDVATGARPDQWLMLVESGGWTMVPMPRVNSNHPSELRGFGGSASVTDAATYLPLAAPPAYGWTLTGTAGTVAASGEWRIDLTAQGEYARAFGSHSTETGINVHFEVKTTTTPADYTTQGPGVEVDLGNGTQDLRVDVRLINAGVGIYDVNAGALLGSAAVNNTDRRVYRLSLQHNGSGNTVALYSRKHGSNYWTLHVTGTATRRTSGGGTTAVRWGHLSAAAASSTWYGVHATVSAGYGNHTQTTDSLSAGLVIAEAPETLPGAPVPVAPGRLHVKADLYMRARKGPGLRGDLWEGAIGYRYAAENTTTRSRQREARTNADNVADYYTWEPNPGNEHHPGGRAVAMAVFDSNCRYHVLRGGDGSTSSLIAELDLADGTTGLSFTRSGDSVRVAAGSTAAFLTALDLVGGTVDMGSGVLRKITAATPGPWNSAASSLTLTIELSGGEPTSGTLDIWRTSGAVVVLGYTTSHRYWIHRRSAQQTADDDYRVGRVVIGHVEVLGQRWSEGRSQSIMPQVAVEQVPGFVAARRLGPTVRSFGIAWTEGAPSKWTTDPPHQTAGGVAIATAGDITPLESVVSQYGSAFGPVVLLPRIVRDAAAVSVETVQLIGRELAIYGHFSTDPQIEDAFGDEAECATRRVSGVEFQEER